MVILYISTNKRSLLLSSLIPHHLTGRTDLTLFRAGGGDFLPPLEKCANNLKLAQAEGLRFFNFYFNLVLHIFCEFGVNSMFRKKIRGVGIYYPHNSIPTRKHENVIAPNDLYLDHKTMAIKIKFPEILVKIRHHRVILYHFTSFSYIFPCYDVIKN